MLPNELSAALLKSDKVIIPFEIAGGGKQVSTIVTVHESRYAAFDFTGDSDKFLGPIAWRRSQLSSEQIQSALDGHNAQHEIAVSKIDITISSFVLNGQCESVIESIDLFGAGGHSLKLKRQGAAYPYCFLLQ